MSKYRHLLLFSCLALIPIGFALKFYSGPGNHWPNNYGAGVVYVIFFSLLAATIWPEEKYRFRIPLIVLLVTCALESLQLWHPPLLEAIRQTFIGAALIGTTFAWWDFPHYIVGALFAYGWLHWLKEK